MGIILPQTCVISIYDFNTPGPGGSRNLEETCHDLTTCDDNQNMDYGRAERKMGIISPKARDSFG